MQAPKTNQTSEMGVSAIPSTYIPSSTASPTPEGILDIDSALQAALKDDRERVALLRLETTMVDFLASPAAWMEVGGPWNSVTLQDPSVSQSHRQAAPNAQHAGRQTSFQRCLVHRLADRFGIVRETGQLLEASIRIIKTAGSKIPSPLLQDMDVSVTALDQLSRRLAHQTLQPNGGNNTTTTTTVSNPATTMLPAVAAPSPKPRKMKIMKRSSKSSGSLASPRTSSSTSNGHRRPFSDKEKAYAEARARIFSDETAQTTMTATALSNGGNPVSHNVPYQRADSLSSASAAAATPSRSASLDSTTGGSSSISLYHRGSGAPIAAAAMATDRKAVYRNYAEEAADPDFQRGAAAVVFQQSYYPATGAQHQQQQQHQHYSGHIGYPPYTATAPAYAGDPYFQGAYYPTPTITTATAPSSQYPGGSFIPGYYADAPAWHGSATTAAVTSQVDVTTVPTPPPKR